MSIKKIFYNSSMPRAGSTLIQNILGQNPEIHTTPTSGVFEMLTSSRTIFSDSLEFKAQDESQMMSGFKGYLKSALYGFYEPLTDKPYVIDKCRGWNSEWEFVNAFDPNPKMICMIRDIRSVYSSLEKKFRKNPLIDHHLANWGNILFVKFENLCSDPNNELKRIYEYLDLPFYQHDFKNIKQVTHEDDKWYGIFGDHIIRPEIQPLKEDYLEVLGPNACRIIEENYAWFFNDFGYKI
jgi:sulfotransferase